jgi:NAD(P)-dependent dehydrogenase (short-subunit alcohol dehydrogenase family)
VNTSQFSLEGKVALITGGSRGIGYATALGLARAGADVVVSSRKLPDLEKVAEEIQGLGRKSLAVTADVGRMGDLGNLVNKVVEKFSRIDILVNNAGTTVINSALETDERDWNIIMDVNLKGLFFLSQAVARVMKEDGGGSIINLASRAGIRPGVMPVYAISKAGVIMATKVMAKEWAQYNIRVNAVAPGAVKTYMTEPLLSSKEYVKDKLKEIPMGRFAQPDEMVGTIIYLAADASGYMTGAVISVDGGSSI